MKKIVFLLLFSLLSFEVAMANTLSWGVTAPGVVVGDHNGLALNVTGAADGTTALVQLIYAGTDGINVANQIGDGTTGDDTVIAYSWIGDGGAFLDGTVIGPNVDNQYANDSLYYIRAWEAPAASVGTGFVPIVPTHYGNSETYKIAGKGPPPLPEAFSVGTAFDTTIAIPEPTVAAFIGVFGGAMLIARRLFSKSQESA